MKPRLVIAVPSTDIVYKDAYDCFGALMLNLGLMEGENLIDFLGVIDYRSCYIDDSRDKTVVTALERDATHIMWLDSDNTYPPDTVFRLLNHKTYIVGAAYTQRVEGGRCVGLPADPSVAQLPREGLTEMELLGAGVLLTRTDVFRSIGEPYFYKHLPRSPGAVGEDAIFCCRAREAGYKIWADGALSYEVGHLGVKEFKLK